MSFFDTEDRRMSPCAQFYFSPFAQIVHAAMGILCLGGLIGVVVVLVLL